MANGIFTIETTGKEIKGKEVIVKDLGLLNEETGELVKFSDIFKPFADQYINFSIKVTEKVEDKFEVPENEDDTEEDE
jgi:hypothetical protein